MLRRLFRHPAMLALATVLAGSLLWSGERIATGQPVFPYTQDSSGAVTFLFPVFLPNLPIQPIGYNATQAPGGRLSLAAQTPVMGVAVAAAGTIFYTPYNGAMIPFFDGAAFYEFQVPADLTNILANSSVGNAGPAAAVGNSCYDLFVWNTGPKTAPAPALTRGPLWTTCLNGAGARSAGTALVNQNGILLNSVAITNGPAASRGTYVGTVSTDAGGATVTYQPGGAVTTAVAGVWNYYNRVTQRFFVVDNSGTYTYSTATIRQARANVSNQANITIGVAEDMPIVYYDHRESTAAASGAVTGAGIGYNSTSTFTCPPGGILAPTANSIAAGSSNLCSAGMAIGQNTISANELGDGTNANTFNASTGGNHFSVVTKW